jgi:DNA-binding transcriptional LysR family regulator
LSDLDLNLLRVLAVVADKRSVSAAAVELRKSQPSVSSALGRLRAFFGDPLFVRSGNTMQPTPRMLEIIGPVRDVLVSVGANIVASPTFDPAARNAEIVLALSDVGEVVFLPKLLPELRRLAPRTDIRSVSLPAADVASGLEAGTIDLAIGYFPNLKQHNFFQQSLFSDTFTCLIRADHPVRSPRLSLRQFIRLEHAVIRAESRTEEVIERFLVRRRIGRRVVLTTPFRQRAADHRAVRSDRDGAGTPGALLLDRVFTSPLREATVRPAAHRSQAVLASALSSRRAQPLAAEPHLRAISKRRKAARLKGRLRTT